MDSQATWSTNGQLSISNHIYVRKLRAYLNPFQELTSVFAFTSSSQVTLEKKVSLRGLLGVHWKVKLHRSAPPNLDSGAWDRAFFATPGEEKEYRSWPFHWPMKRRWNCMKYVLVLVCLGSSDFPGVSSFSLLNHPMFAVWCDHCLTNKPELDPYMIWVCLKRGYIPNPLETSISLPIKIAILLDYIDPSCRAPWSGNHEMVGCKPAIWWVYQTTIKYNLGITF